jgi:hypothetical protein
MNIKELAEQVGLAYKTADGHYWIDAGYVDVHLERFAELVAAAEREKCARLCDDLSEGLVGDDVDGAWGAGHCARAIEARGEK